MQHNHVLFKCSCYPSPLLRSPFARASLLERPLCSPILVPAPIGGFKASFGKQPTEMLAQRVAAQRSMRASWDAASVAVAAVGPSMGVDMAALKSLVASARGALAQASR